MVFLSPGTRDAHPQMELIENAHVRLRNHEKDVPALRQDAIDALAAPGTPVLVLHAVLDRVGTAISLERVAQGLLGLAVAAAALVFVGQALARSVSLIDDDAIVLRALGFTRQDRAVAAAAPHLVTACVAVPVALLGSASLRTTCVRWRSRRSRSWRTCRCGSRRASSSSRPWSLP